MSVLGALSSLALKGAAQATGGEALGTGAEALVVVLRQRFSDNSMRLNQALQKASDRAWRAVELALAGTSWWERCKLALSSTEQRAFRDQVQAFLHAHPLDNVDGHGPDFRAQCLGQLQAARKAGLLTRGQVDPDELARRVGDLSRFGGDRTATVAAELRAVDEIVAQVRQYGYEALATFLELRPAAGPPVLLAAVRYFFQREVENDRELFQGLAYARLEGLAEGQSGGFADLAEALDAHTDRLETLLADVQAVVVQTRGDVLDIKSELARQGQQMQELGRAVLDALRQHQLERRELHGGDSLSVRDEAERRLVKDLVRRYRALPAQQRQGMPALLNAVGKLEVVAGDFAAAQNDFRALAELVPEGAARAEAAHNAYRAALEQRSWGEALASLQEAMTLDPARFSPFPADKFAPEKILGAGGFGVAFLCRNRHSGALVVIKTLRRDGLDRDLGEVFREAQTLEELEHPAIIRVRDCDYADAARTRPYLVMDYFQAQNLAEHVEQHGPLPAAELLPLARLVAEGMQRAHGRGILHRDVKPANVLVRRGGEPGGSSPRSWQVKLIDFGLALRASTAHSTMKASLDRTLLGSSIAGTLEYAAPEQMGKLKGVAVGPYSDVYGFGKTCCFALFGTPQPTFQHWQQLPRELADLLGRCLAEQPSQRPHDFTAVLAELDRLLAPRPAATPVPRDLPRAKVVEVPVPQARLAEPRRPEPHRPEPPRSRPRRRLDDLDEVEPPRKRRSSGGALAGLLLLGLVLVAVLGLTVGATFLGLRRPTFSSPQQSVLNRPLWPGTEPEVRYEPIREDEFPAVLKELKGNPGADRKREIAGRLGETEPTKSQKAQHEKAEKLRRLLAQKPPGTTQEAVDEAEAKDDITHVSVALDPLTQANDHATQKAVAKALRRWGTAKNVDGLIRLTAAVGAKGDSVRLEACLALANLKDPRGAEAVAKMLEGDWSPDWNAAKQSLIAFGPMAEEFVLPRLQSAAWGARPIVLAILEAVGSEKSIAALQALPKDTAAQNALAVIRARAQGKANKGTAEEAN
jgi:serine/threonine protein kinase